MAELFKSSTQAGQEVRSRGQTGVQIDPTSQSLDSLGKVEGPRLGIRPSSPAATNPSLIDDILKAYDSGVLGQPTTAAPAEANPIQQVLNAYDSTAPQISPAATPAKEVGFIDSVQKGAKGLMLTWDYLANKLETAVTGSGSDTAPILQKSVEEYKALASDPRIQQLIQQGNDAPDYYEGAKAMLKYIASNPGVAVNFLGEQLPAMAAAVLPGGVVGLTARGLAARGGLSATQSAAVGTAAFGAATNSSAVILGSLGTNYVEGLDKFQGDTQAASDYAATKTLAEVPANAVAGLFMGINPLSRVAATAPRTAIVGNAAFQAGVQGAGGGVGAYQAAQAVGEEVGKGELLAEIFGEAAFAPIEVATSGGLRRPGAVQPQGNVTVQAAPASFNNVSPIEPAPTVPSQIAQQGLTDPEFFGLQKSQDGPAFLASLYSQGDENTRAQLQNYADKTRMNLDLANASQNANLVSQGNSIISNNPTFAGQFQERLGEFYQRTRPIDTPFAGGAVSSAPSDLRPTRESIRIAKDLADQGIMEAEGVFTREKPAPKADTQIGLDRTPTEMATPIPSEPSPLARLSQAEAQVRQGLPVDTTVSTAVSKTQAAAVPPQTAQIKPQGEAVIQGRATPQVTPIVAPEAAPAEPTDITTQQATQDAEPQSTQAATQVQVTQDVTPPGEAPVETTVAQDTDRVSVNVPQAEAVPTTAQAPVQEIKDKRPIEVINADPNRVQRGTFREQPKTVAPDVQEQERMAKQAKENQEAQRREFEAEPFTDIKGIALVNTKLENDSSNLIGSLLDAQGLVVGKVFDTKRSGLYMIRNAKAGEAIEGSSANVVARIASIPQALKRGKETLTFRDERRAATPVQQSLQFMSPEQKQKLNSYEAQAQRIMTTMFTPSTVDQTLVELRQKLKDIYNRQRPFFKFNKKQSDVEYIFDQFAQVGAMESGSKRSNPVAAIAKAIESAQKADVNARAGLLKIHAAKISDELVGLQQKMEADGFSSDVIDRVVGQKLAGLQVFEQADTVEEVNNSVGTVNEDTTQAELNFPDIEQSDRIQAALNAIAAIEASGGSDMSALWNEMRLPKKDREFQFSDFRKALAMSGKELTAVDREVSQFPAATTRLADFVFGNPKGQAGNYASRDAWVRSYEQIKNIYSDQPEKFAEFEKSITDGEKRVIAYINQKRDALKRRRQEQFDRQLSIKGGTRAEYVNALYDDVQQAFPHALFNTYSLKELADPNNIPEGDRAALEGLVYGELKYLHRLWLDDVTYALDARKDLKQQIMDGLTKEEQRAVIEYKNKTDKVILDNGRRNELRVYMSMLDYMQGLDPKAYAVFQNRILISDLNQASAIIHQAELMAEAASLANNKNELISALQDQLAQIYQNDITESTALDNEDANDNVAAIDGQEMPEISNAEVQAEIERAARTGEGFMTGEDARISLLYKKIADAAARYSDDSFVIEPAADVSTQPETNVILSGDVLYKRGKNSHGPAASTVAAHLSEITADWDVKPSYTVLMNPAQISDPEVRARVLGRFDNGAFKGAIDTETGQVYLFSQYLDDVADAEFVLFHELYGHWGMRYFLGDRLNSFLETQYRLNDKVRNEADRQFQDAAASQQPMSRLESIEEAIADIAAKGDSSLFRELIGRLVDWLRKAGVDSVADWLDSTGDRQLAFILSSARTAVRTQGVSPLNGAPSEVLFARNKNPVEIFATRDGQTTGYARLNPVTREWTVFILDKKDGTFSSTTVEEYDQAYAILKKVGKPVRSTDRGTRQEVDPASIKQIPAFDDVEGWKKFARKLQINIQNQYLPVFEVSEFLSKSGADNTVIQDLKLYEGRLKFFVDDMRKRYQEPIQKLLKTIGDKGGDIRSVDRFLLAQHAEERNKQINKINPTNFSGSGMDNKTARELLQNNNDGQWEAYRPELESLGRLMDKMSKDHVNYMVQTGLVDANTAEALNVYSNYRNLSGNEDLGLDKFDKSDLGPNGFNFKGREVQTALGRGTEPVDILQNTMNAYLSTLIRGQKARVNRSILQMLEQNPDPNFVQINPIAEKKRLNLDRLIADKKILKYIGDAPNEGSGRKFLESLKKSIADGSMTADEAQSELINRINLAEQQRVVEPADALAAIRKVNAEIVISGRIAPDGYVSMVEDPNLIRDPNVLVARVDGKPILMRFTDQGKQFVQSISGASQQSRSDLVQLVGAWGRFFSQLITSWNPAWVLPNGFRDAQTAFANASADPEVGPVLAAKMTKEWYPSLKVAFRYLVADQSDTTGGWWGSYLGGLKQRKPLTPEEMQLYEEFRRNGAETFFLDRQNVEETIESMNRHMSGPNGMLELTKDKLESVGKFMELMSMPMETAPRFAMYKVLRQNGWTEERAATYAKEITVNFNMKGASQNFRSLYVFANPAVQGTYRMFQNYSAGDKGFARFMPSAQFSKVAGVWIVMGIMGNMIARAVGGEDEDKPGVDKLDMIPNYKRSTSLILAPDVPGGAIPIAYGWNVFHTLGHYMADVFGGKLKVEEAASRVLTAAFDSFAPIGSGAESQTAAGAFLKTITPSILTPIVDIASNENRFGAPIFKEQNPFSDVKEANSYMHFDTVNPMSRSLMRGLNNATGGNQYKKGLIDINPGAVDYFIQSYLPGIFTEVYKGAGLAIQKMRGEDTKRAPIPLIDRLSARVPEGYDAGAMRRAAESIETKYKEFMDPNTTRAEKTEILRQHPNLGAAKAVISGVDQQIKALRQQLQSINSNPNLSEEYKVTARNKIKEQEKMFQNRAVNAAIRAGFRDAVIGNSTDQGLLNRAGGLVRESAED